MPNFDISPEGQIPLVPQAQVPDATDVISRAVELNLKREELQRQRVKDFTDVITHLSDLRERKENMRADNLRADAMLEIAKRKVEALEEIAGIKTPIGEKERLQVETQLSNIRDTLGQLDSVETALSKELPRVARTTLGASVAQTLGELSGGAILPELTQWSKNKTAIAAQIRFLGGEKDARISDKDVERMTKALDIESVQPKVAKKQLEFLKERLNFALNNIESERQKAIKATPGAKKSGRKLSDAQKRLVVEKFRVLRKQFPMIDREELYDNVVLSVAGEE